VGNKNRDEQLADTAGRWLTDIRNPDVRSECREEIEEWLSDDEWDSEVVRTAQRFWRRLLTGSAR
jgi:ferric-dicitrate binding protein FerR (iron transport regulator)